MKDFSEYQKWFEASVSKAVGDGLVGKLEAVPVLAGKLSRTKFGRSIGSRFITQQVMAIDYYGLLKKSDGFFLFVEDLRSKLKGRQLKIVTVMVVHFASLKLEVMAKIEPQLLSGFSDYKNAILVSRGFK